MSSKLLEIQEFAALFMEDETFRLSVEKYCEGMGCNLSDVETVKYVATLLIGALQVEKENTVLRRMFEGTRVNIQ